MNTHLKTILTFIGLFVIIPFIGWCSLLFLDIDVVGSAIEAYYIAGFITSLIVFSIITLCCIIYFGVYTFWDEL